LSDISGGYGHYRVERKGAGEMRVPDLMLKSVGFLAEVAGSESSAVNLGVVATGFFVSIPASDPTVGGVFLCFVTAKHVAAFLKDRPFAIIVNKRGGGIMTVPVDVIDNKWWLHPTDKTADVALIPLNPHPDMDIAPIWLQNFLPRKDFETRKIGIGDEVFITGLFTYAPGRTRNMPIVRHGNIAMIPEEQIQTELGFADVYLIEARSIGGLSGSPVLVRETVGLAGQREDRSRLQMMGLGDTYLLGLMHGHWDIREAQINEAQFSHDPRRGVNLGIGIVVPSDKIIDILERPELKAKREEREETVRRARIPSPDITKAFTQAEFETALKKASRKIEPKKK
jgi:hypothetical protein